MNARDKLDAKIASLTTEQLFEIATRLNLANSIEEVMVCNAVDRELGKRLSEEEFSRHLDAMDAMLDAA